MARFDFYEILINHPTWEESFHDITDPDIRREIMCDVEDISSEIAPTAMQQTGSEIEWVDLIFNDDVDPAVVVAKTRELLWNYSESMIVDLVETEAAKHAEAYDA
jgi:hypothetical protein